MCERCEVTSNSEFLCIVPHETNVWMFCERSGGAYREKVAEGTSSVFVLFVHELFWDGDLDTMFKKKR